MYDELTASLVTANQELRNQLTVAENRIKDLEALVAEANRQRDDLQQKVDKYQLLQGTFYTHEGRQVRTVAIYAAMKEAG